MNRFLVLWLLLASSVPGGLLCQNICANKNSMLEKLRRAGVTVYTSAQSNSQYCSSEWKPNGTCCDPVSAGVVMKRKTDKNTQEFAAMIREIESLPGAVQSFQQNAEPTMIYTSRSLTRQKMQKIVDYINANKISIQNWQSGCMNRLNTLTRTSTCSICSGQSQRFFRGSKILMKMGVCKQIIGDCEQAWRSVVYILDLLEDYTQEVKKSYIGQLATEHFDSLKSTSSKHNLSKYFSQCSNLKNCPDSVLAPICEHLVSILAPSYADYVAGQIEKTRKTVAGKILQAIGKFFSNAANAAKETVKKVANAIGGLFKKKDKKKGSSTAQAPPPISAQAPPAAAMQYREFAHHLTGHQLWQLSDHSGQTGRMLSEDDHGDDHDNNQQHDDSNTDFTNNCQDGEEIMVDRDQQCSDCPDFGYDPTCP